MKKIIILTIILASLATLAMGQDRDERADKLEARKVAFISTELELTTKEAQGFWPIYNEYQEQHKVNKKRLKGVTKGKKIESISETEADKLIKVVLEVEEKEVKIKREYTNELRSVLPSTKIAKLYLLEKKFKQKVLNKIKRKMKDRRR